MNLLLDTHIWLWFLMGIEELPKRWQKIIADEANTLWLSPISVWETMILSEKGRIQLQPNAEDWIRQAFKELPLNEAKLNHEIAILSRSLPLTQQDPADRFIAASAQFYELTLITMDRSLRQSKKIPTLAL